MPLASTTGLRQRYDLLMTLPDKVTLADGNTTILRIETHTELHVRAV